MEQSPYIGQNLIERTIQKASQEFVAELMSPESSAEIIERVLIKGGPFFREEGRDRKLTRELLAEQGLAPRYRMEVGDTAIWIPDAAFYIDNGYEYYFRRSEGERPRREYRQKQYRNTSSLGIVAYVEDKRFQTVIPRSFYYDTTEQIWKYLHGYTYLNPRMSEEGFRYAQQDLAYDSRGKSIVAPVALQKGFSDIATKSPILSLADSDLVFAGTTSSFPSASGGALGGYRYDSYDALQLNNATFSANIQKAPATDYTREVRPLPVKLEGNFYPDPHGEIDFSGLRFANENQAPDFTRLLARFALPPIDTQGQSNATMEIFASKDGNFIFMVYQNATGSIRIAGVENASQLTSTGLRSEWVEGGLLTQSFNAPDKTEAEMIALLKQIPVIQEYVRAREIRPTR